MIHTPPPFDHGADANNSSSRGEPGNLHRAGWPARLTGRFTGSLPPWPTLARLPAPADRPPSTPHRWLVDRAGEVAARGPSRSSPPSGPLIRPTIPWDRDETESPSS